MMNDVEIQADRDETKGQDNHLKIDTVFYNENVHKENDLIQFIVQTQKQGYNCIDLSKKKIKEFPYQLLEFPILKYLYLEGNQLTALPHDLFVRLPNLKWLDLRHNQLTFIPNYGLAEHHSLQYLLLSGNLLQSLPFELGKVKTLSALNLDGNPLNYPPWEIIKQGVKSIKKYLRHRLDLSSSEEDDDDVDDFRLLSKQSNRIQSKSKDFSRPTSVYHRKSKSEIGHYDTACLNSLPPHLQSCIQYKRMTCSETRPQSQTRSRPQSEMRYSSLKLHRFPNSNHDDDDNKSNTNNSMGNEDHPSILLHMKHREITIDDEIQNLNRNTFITHLEEPIIQTPFHIDSQYIQRLNNKERPHVVRSAISKSRISEPSINTFDAKRLRDQQIQERIRQITDTMLKRRLEARGNPVIEKRQLKLELRELHKLGFESSLHQPILIDQRAKSAAISSRIRRNV